MDSPKQYIKSAITLSSTEHPCDVLSKSTISVMVNHLPKIIQIRHVLFNQKLIFSNHFYSFMQIRKISHFVRLTKFPF